ncbi:MAG: hypothetical protein WBP08_06145 [Saprospiraceae bacterium]|nr:hypothetical protein [Saprospiraceae bacterium]
MEDKFIHYDSDKKRQLFIRLSGELIHNDYIKLTEAESLREKYRGFHRARKHLNSILEGLDNLEKLLKPLEVEYPGSR